MFSQAKLYAAGSVLIIIFGLGAAVWVQGVRIDGLRAELKQEHTNTSICVQANTKNAEAIDEMKKERERMSGSCEIKLANKDAVIKKLQDIIGAGGKGNGTGGQTESEGVGVGGGNSDGTVDILDVLHGMLPRSLQGGSDADGVRARTGSAGTSRASLSPGVVGYCLDEVNAKSLAANVAALRGWALEMKIELDSHQTGTGGK